MSERSGAGIARRRLLSKTAGFIAASTIAGIGGTKSALAETPVPTIEPTKTPTPDPLDVGIEEARRTLQQIQKDKPKKKILDDLRVQINAELNPDKTPTPVSAPDPRDAQIAALQKQLTDNQRQFEDFKRTLLSDPNVKVFTDAQLKSYIDSGVEIKLKAKEAEEADRRVTEAVQRAQDAQRIAADKEEAQRLKTVATEESKRQLVTAKAQAEAMKGKIELPLVGEVPDKAAMAGAGFAGGLLGRWVVRPIEWTRGATRLIRRMRGGPPAAPGSTPPPTT